MSLFQALLENEELWQNSGWGKDCVEWHSADSNPTGWQTFHCRQVQCIRNENQHITLYLMSYLVFNVSVHRHHRLSDYFDSYLCFFSSFFSNVCFCCCAIDKSGYLSVIEHMLNTRISYRTFPYLVSVVLWFWYFVISKQKCGKTDITSVIYLNAKLKCWNADVLK